MPQALTCNADSNTKAFAKNPAKGGIPAIEKSIRVKESANIGLTFAKIVKS